MLMIQRGGAGAGAGGVDPKKDNPPLIPKIDIDFFGFFAI
jgi:hypothetical protein